MTDTFKPKDSNPEAPLFQEGFIDIAPGPGLVLQDALPDAVVTTATVANGEKTGRVGRYVARGLVAAICTIPVVDTFGSDVATTQVYQTIDSAVDLKSPVGEKGLELLLTGAAITLESLLVGAPIARNKKLRGSFQASSDYTAARQAEMQGARRLLSLGVNLPLTALDWSGNKVKAAGKKMEASPHWTVRHAGPAVVEIADINARGTSTKIMDETVHGNPPSIGRMTKFGGEIAISWLGAASGIQLAYEKLEGKEVKGIPVGNGIRHSLAFIGKGFKALTTPDSPHIHNVPISAVTMTAAAIGLGTFGWNAAKYAETHPQLEPAIANPELVA